MTFRMVVNLCLCIWLLVLAMPVSATPLELKGDWYQAAEVWDYQLQYDMSETGLPKVSHTKNTGGVFLHQADINLDGNTTYVVDFKNSSVIERFTHYVFDDNGDLVLKLTGGIASATDNPFMLRHGREIKLPAGHYRIISELYSSFYLAQPQPYIDTLDDYRQAIKPGNAIVLICVGAMLILMVYYSVLGYVRGQRTDTMYALFIAGNLIYNSMAMLVAPDLFGVHWFYLVSIPILFSNFAYVLFVSSLLGIKRHVYRKLHALRRWSLALLGIFLLVALLFPNWSMEMDRYGVGVIMSYGLLAGIVCSYRGNRTARMYLVAIVAFFAIGAYAITNSGLEGIYTIYIEHIGLLAVTVEMVLLALVLARQFAQLHYEKEYALNQSEHNLQIAYTDALTGLPNRYALDKELEHLPQSGLLVFVDMDGLKFYNDNFGHKRGDELLCAFASAMRSELMKYGVLHRIGGDEFAITFPSGDLTSIETKLHAAMQAVHAQGFDFSGISYGIAMVSESADRNVLKHLADTRMYEHKRQRKKRSLSS